jgi:hypothetical protein
MLTLSYTALAAYTLALAVLYLSLGAALARWWEKPPPPVWARRRDRELDEARWRDGAPYDGQYRGVRWLPSDHEEP